MLKGYIKTGVAATVMATLLLPGCAMLPADPPPTAAPPSAANPPAAAPAPGAANPPSLAPRVLPGAGQARVPGEYLVTLAHGADVAAISAVYGRLGVRQIEPVTADVYLLTLRDDPGPDAMESLRKRDARIKATQPNFVYRMQPGGGPQ